MQAPIYPVIRPQSEEQTFCIFSIEYLEHNWADKVHDPVPVLRACILRLDDAADGS